MNDWEKQESSFLRQEYKRLTVQNEALSAELKRARKDLEHEKEKRFEMCMACELRKAENVVNKTFYCDRCGKGTAIKSRFCAHCGAKMDGEPDGRI